MAKGPTVTLTFAGDAQKLKGTVREVQSSTTTLQKGLGGLAAGLGGIGLAGVAAGGLAAGAIAGIGLAVAGAGAMAAAQSEKVKSAFTGLGEHVKSSVQELAKPFEPVLLGIEQKARATFDRVKPLLGEMFNVSAPYLDKLADGLLGFVEGALPGLKAGLEQAKPIITAISDGIKGLGPKLGEMFKNMSGGEGGAQAAADSIKQLFDWVGWLLPKLGSLINFLTEWGPTLLPIAAGIGGIVAAIRIWTTTQAALNVVMALNPIGLIVIAIVALVAAIVWAWNNCESFRNVVKTVWESVKSAFQSGVDKAKALFAWFGELPGKIGAWFGRAKDAAKAKIDGLVADVKAIPGKITSALGNLGSLLYNSGRSLLEGLWNGAKGALQWVKDRFRDALSAIRNLFPFSPAKEGPFSGSGYTTHSGRALMTDFGKGMTQGPDLRAIAAGALRPAQGALSGSTAGGAAGGGSLQLTVGAGADSVMAAAIMHLVRTGQLQLARA